MTDSDVVYSTKNAQDIDDDTPQKGTVTDPIREQRRDTLCPSLMDEIVDTNSMYLLDEKQILSRRFCQGETVQRVIPTKLQVAILYHTHDPVLAGHPGGPHMYHTMKCLCYWAHIASDVY